MTFSEGIEVASLVVSVLALVAGTVVTIVVYQLSRRLDFRARLHTWDELHRVVRAFAADMHENGLNTDVLLLNADRYEKDYDGGNRLTRHGWIQLRSEYIDVRHNGISLLADVVPAWRDGAGRLVLKKTNDPAGNVLRVGLVPFEWVEHIEPHGNEYKNAPLIYVHFRGRGRSPYASFTYHQAQFVPMGPRDRPYYPEIPELGVTRVGRIAGWVGYWRQWWTDRKIRAGLKL